MSAIAICCGFNDYQTSPLNTALNDANGIYACLMKERAFQVDSQLFRRSCTITHSEATAAHLLGRLEDACARAELVWFSFSGHGLIYDGELHLLLPGWRGPSSTNHAVSARDLENALRGNRLGKLVIIIDACHAGAFGMTRDLHAAEHAGASRPTTIISAGGVVMSACSHDELAQDGNPRSGMLNGVFTHHLLEVLVAHQTASRSLGALQLFLETSRRMRLATQHQTPTLYANGVTDDFRLLVGDAGDAGDAGGAVGTNLADVPPRLQNELRNFLDSMRIIACSGQIGLAAAERELEKLAHKFYECRAPTFTVDNFEAHVTEAYENAHSSVVACTTPAYFDAWRDDGVARSLLAANESFIKRGGQVLRFYFVNGDFKNRYPELASVIREHLSKGVCALVVHVDKYKDTVLRQIFGGNEIDLDRLEFAFVDGATYLRTRFEMKGIRIEVAQVKARCDSEYKFSLRPFLSEHQDGIYQPTLDRNHQHEIDWGPPLTPQEAKALRKRVDELISEVPES